RELKPCHILHFVSISVLGGEAVPVNPCSKYEDMKFSPDADGVYEFYLNMAGETPTVYVKKP
ncbi:hypothetical protein SFC38_11665, partial [Aeromonas veronii]